MSEPFTMSHVECRVVGSLIEKSFLTPDVYPMTTNAMVSACNQKTNRDPIVAYDAVSIDAALLDLRQRNLVRRVHVPGSRSTKHRQTLDEALDLSEPELAMVAVLLLRGHQTPGELRQRTERMHPFETLAEIDDCLEALAGRDAPLVRVLERQPGQTEARWAHLFGDPDQAFSAAPPTQAPPVQAPPTQQRGPSSPAGHDELEARVALLEETVATLERRLGDLADEPLD